MRATMDKVDDGVPFVLAGTVTSWDPVARVLDVGDNGAESQPLSPSQPSRPTSA
jgi:hypothetical protein